MKQTIFAAVTAAALAGCATTGSALDQAGPPFQAPGEMTCNAGPAQSHLGKSATQAEGAAILRDSGARTLRWGPPNGAWAMDFRQDRVNVLYDEAMIITGITCG